MAIQNRGGNFADFDPFKMLPREFAYLLDTEELYYCVAPGNVKRVATKEDIVQILDTNQEAYDGLQQLLIELENETVASGILNDISDLLVKTAQHDGKIDSLENRTTINETNIIQNTNNIEANYNALEDFMNIPPLALKRVDTLTGRMQITSTNYASPNVVPLKEPYGENLYLICFEIGDVRNAPSIIWTGTTGNAAGYLLIGADAGNKAVTAQIIRSGNNVGFYNATGAAGAVYVTAVYKLD